ncbi:BgTH12-06433 [Blumeria graminis f. sp. triticale]|uniref:Bgt-1140 n=3 Tax=Blumeria graminis TaxID=34373 RepID=A0A061HJE9_BLUGR|nr:Peroxisomal AMP-binding protein [Blumeria graminis f. sp. tritici 96224]CAD6500726.1 BgTH12-06433 [Blumeria graminis f. sp. triticale]VCU41004.1 Bgt-1140 [Blumeria graminis f. sp. tritici]
MASTLFNTFSAGNHASAIIIPGKIPLTISFKDLTSEVLAFQMKLALLGITPKAVVSLALPNSYEFIVAFLATTCQRAISAPLNPAFKQDEYEFYLKDVNSAALLLPRGAYSQEGPAVRAARKQKTVIAECYWNGREVVLDVKEEGSLQGQGNQKLERAQPYDIALVLHTSGTTGRPKAVPLSHRNIVRSIKNIQATYALDSQDRSLLVMPLFHVHGLLSGLLAPLYGGGSVIVPLKFSASGFWSDFISHRANWYTAVPTIHQILLKNPLPSPLPRIRFIRSCSSPLSPTTFHALEKALKAPVLEAYAMTEACHQISSNLLPPARRRPGSVGVGQGVAIQILNQKGDEVPTGTEGEVCIKGGSLTAGYLNNPTANQESYTKLGYFRTGDQGKVDSEGYLYITGRIKELINKGGEKISPIELDNVLVQHPKVAQAVSFAIPDSTYGQNIGVAILPVENEKIDQREIKDWVEERLAAFKIPKEVFFTHQMPQTATGKIQRRIVAEEMMKQQIIKAKL